MTGFIDDGYTERGFIAAAKGLYPALRFEFRPMLVTELAQFAARTAHASDEAVRREVARWLSQKLVVWDLRDAQGQDVHIRPAGLDPLANLLRLKPPLFVKLWKIVCCDIAGDPPHDGTIDLEADAKNWPAGCGCGCCTPPSPAGIAATVCVTSTSTPQAAD